MRHGIDLKPIHNVKDAGQFPASRPKPDLVFSSLEYLAAAPAKHRYAACGLVERIGIEPMTSSLQS